MYPHRRPRSHVDLQPQVVAGERAGRPADDVHGHDTTAAGRLSQQQRHLTAQLGEDRAAPAVGPSHQPGVRAHQAGPTRAAIGCRAA
ncbi:MULTISPECIES: hypothetical protein [unclassified Micromonospora]|uniref:hypothetical protein n=1 Tax=unclassified Micromonospora TaxID=2617518 RepID=UPI00259CB99A|nr:MULTISPECIES: hypothetical protein [unclassified Micromonospora]MDM4781274.1 hypothetical protein [Micromonospora sp. b486]